MATWMRRPRIAPARGRRAFKEGPEACQARQGKEHQTEAADDVDDYLPVHRVRSFRVLQVV